MNPSGSPQPSFAQPATAQANLERLQERLPESLFALLPTVLAQVPDPDGALNRLERFTRELGPRVVQAMVRQPALLHYLLVLFAHSLFLSEMLIQQPELILWLGREKNLARVKSREELLEEYARFEATALDVEPSLALARFKRRQYLRITLRDLLGLATLVETTLELSTLADVLLEKALATAERELRARYGAPQTHDTRGRLVPARFGVVSLGKLGGNELNYSSDIDLLFLYDGEGETSATVPARRLSNSEYYFRLAQRVVQIIAGVTREGPVFRIDLRLRPGGQEGDLVLSLPALLDYYQHRAQEWEPQMLLKARYSAGAPELVRTFLSSLEPFLFRGAMHFAAVESVVKAREQMNRKLDSTRGDRLNVKLAAGGIRDIEFLAQCLQRLYGRSDPWVRAEGTLVALQKLYDKGYLPARDHFHLASAYQFLRRVEHRLQLEQGQQTHTLPGAAGTLTLLARRCGVEERRDRPAGKELLRQLQEHLRRVQAVSERVLPRTPPTAEAERFQLRAPEVVIVPGELSYAELLNRLRGLKSPLTDQLEGIEIPPRTQKTLGHFLAAALASSSVFEEVNRAAAALPRAAEALRLSGPLGVLLTRRPERVAALLALGSGEAVSASHQREIGLTAGVSSALPAALAAPSGEWRSLPESMAGLRRHFSDAVFEWGAREVCQRPPVEQGLRRYSMLAEQVLRAGLAIAEQHAGPVDTEVYAVIALGRLGTAEMDLGSDADLVFLAARPEAVTPVRPVVEKLLHVISGYTRDGTIFPVDVRLRPRGGEGELVQTGEHALDYFSQSAEVWEAVTYLKARPVAGDLEWGQEWCRQLREVLRTRFAEWAPIQSALREMRRRLEEEGAKGMEDRDNFKTGVGGFYDFDFIFSALALRGGAASMAGCPLTQQAECAESSDGLSASERGQLGEAARLLRTVDHAIRLVTGRGAAQLPRGPRAELVAELAGGFLGESLTAAALARRVEEVRQGVRRIYGRVFA